MSTNDKKTESAHQKRKYKDILSESIQQTLNEQAPSLVIQHIDTNNIDSQETKMSITLNNNAPQNVKNTRLSKTLTVALVYQDKPLGTIDLHLPNQGIDTQQIRGIFEHLATDIAFNIKRHQAHKRIQQQQHMDMQWIGDSEQSRAVDQFIEKASNVDFPVLIQGETGTGKLLVANSIHQLSRYNKAPFIEGHCATWSESDTAKIMEKLWIQARGGTLFLHDIDQLSDKQISIIRHYWRYIVNSERYNTGNARIITSSTDLRSLSERRSEQQFDYLTIRLPSLNERRNDIKALMEHNIEKLSYINDIQLSEDCWTLFEQFDWHDNLQELERMASKLVIMSESNHLNPSAVLAIIPQLHDTQGKQINLPENNPQSNQNQLDSIAQQITHNQYIAPTQQHPALSKAMNYIAEHYHNEVTLTELANNAFVSPSHLSYLFKQHLSTTFKQLLIQIRIEKAKQLLNENHHYKVTNIAYEVGFRDLSHFEKTFKRLVGVSPGKYRTI